MTFTVTYRAKDGALREERVDAANRAECVAECRKRGIAPTGIREGGKGKGRDGARPSRVGAGDNKRTTARRVAAAVVVAAIAGGVWWWMGRGQEKPKTASVQQRGPKKPKAEKPKAERAEQRPSVATNATAAQPQPKPAAPSAWIVFSTSATSDLESTLSSMSWSCTASALSRLTSSSRYSSRNERTAFVASAIGESVFPKLLGNAPMWW